MSNALEFIMRLTDQLSPAMFKAAGATDNATARIQADLNRATGGARTFTYSLQQLKSRLDSINSTRMSTHIPDVFRTATREAQRLERQIDRIENKGKAPGGIGLGGIISTAALFMGGRDVINTGVRQQSNARAINFTTGGRGDEAMGFIKDQSNGLGLNQEAMQIGFKTLSGGLRGLNFDLKQQEAIMSGVNKGIATFGLQGEESKRVYLALGQIASKSTVQAEELRQQIGEVVPGAFSIAAKAMGKTEKELNKMMDTGQLMSKDFLPKFAAQMEKEFGQSAIDASTGAAASMNRFENTMLKIKTTIAKDILPPFIKVLGFLATGFEWIVANKDIFFPLAAGIGAIILVTQGWAVAQGIVNAVMALNPIILIIGLIIALGMWIYNLSQKYEGWGQSIKAVWEIIKAFFRFNLIIWKSFGETVWYYVEYGWLKFKSFVEWTVLALGNLGAAFKALFNGDFAGAKDALTREIITPSSKALDELTKKHKATQAEFQQSAIGELKTIVNNSKLIGLKKKPGTADATTANAAGAYSAPGGLNTAGTGNGTANSRSEAINNGGARSIIINIAKQIGVEQIHVMSGKDALSEIEQAVKEVMRRAMYSANGLSTTAD